MRKLVLFALAITFVIGVNAQKDAKRFAKQMPIEKAITDNYAPVNTNPAISGTKGEVYVGKAGNIYYALLEEQRAMNYDPASGLLQMIHRADPATYPEANNSGSIVSSQSTDGGANWNYCVILPGDGTNLTRYPQGYIYNVDNNTDPTQVVIGATGPSHTGGNWNNNFFVSGTNNCADMNDNFVPMGCSFEAVRQGTAVTDNGYVYALSSCTEDDGSAYTQFDMNTYRGELDGDHINFGDASFSTVDALGVTTYWWGTFSTAWSQDGSIGYIFGVGLLNDFAGQSAYNPIAWKSTDNGATWELIVTGMNMVDFAGLEDVLVESTDGHYIPLFKGTSAGTVDANGDLQFFGECYSGSTLNVDECYIGAENDENYRLLNVTINAEEGITGFNFVANFLSNDVGSDSEYAYAAGADGVGWSHRIQTSRSEDGLNYFVVYGDTENAGTLYGGENAKPDMYLWGKNINTPGAMPANKMTEGGTYWFHYTSDIAVQQSQYVFMIPTTTTVTQVEMLTNTDLDPVTIEFIEDMTYDVLDGVEDNMMNASIEVSQNQPNPFSGTSTINVNLDRKADLSLEVYNTIGQKVYDATQGQVNAGNYHFTMSADKFEAGVYFYTVKANDTKVTKKMIVQ